MPEASSTFPFPTPALLQRCAVAVTTLLAVVFAGDSLAQNTVPGAARERIRAAMGSNIETFSILGSDRSVSSGSYESKLNPNSSLDITRLPIRWISTTDYNLFGLKVAPVLRTGVAWGEASSTLIDEPLVGDQTLLEALTFNLGLGGRIRLSEGFSLTPSMDFVYADSEQTFTPRSDAGRIVDRELSGELVNWDAGTITYAPKIDLTYRRSFGALDFWYTGGYGYFQTDVVSGEADFESDSQILGNLIGVEFPLGFSLLDYPLRSEVEFTRMDIDGGIERSLATDHFYMVKLALLTRETKRFPLLTRVGIDGSYSWADSFDGWSVGLTGTFDFDRFIAWFY